MGCINQFIKVLEETLKLKGVKAKVIDGENIYDKEDVILYNIKGSGRIKRLFTLEFQIKYETSVEATICQFSLSEFPSCCGKAIVHKIQFGKEYYDEQVETVTIEDQKYLEITKELVLLWKRMFKFIGYSSFDFILSDIDNRYLYQSMKETDIKPCNSFSNSRYDNFMTKHNCDCYAISLNEFKEKENPIKAEKVLS